MPRLFSRSILAFLVVAVFVGITGAAQTTTQADSQETCVPRPVISPSGRSGCPVPCGPNDDESLASLPGEMRATVKP